MCAVCLYQTAELEQSRRTSSMIIESGRVSMGTGAPLPPQVFVVVNSMETLVTVSFRALSVVLLSRLGPGKGFDKVHLVLELHKPPVVQNWNFRVDFRGKHVFFFFSRSNSQTDLNLTHYKTCLCLSCFQVSTAIDSQNVFYSTQKKNQRS